MHVNNKPGFTIVELLIVIVVIGILAAIVIVAYNGVQNRTHDSAIQSDLRNIAGRLQAHKAINGSLPTGSTTVSALDGFDPVSVTKGSYTNASHNLYYCRGTIGSHEQFALVAVSKSGKGYKYESDGGLGDFTSAIGSSGAACDGTNVPRSSTNFSYSYGLNQGSTTWYAWVK